MTHPRHNWQPKKLNELGFVGRGKSRHRPRNDPSLYGGPYPFFQTGDIKAAELYLTKYEQTYSEAGLAQSKLWKPGTVCITIAANIAETAILGIEGCFPDSVVGFIADPKMADAGFVKYYLDTIKLQMQSVSQGTTQDNLSLDKLLTFDILTPPLPVQAKIAAVLSAYDDLIANSARRIAVLGDMAEALYREWFVHFRFPGHEQAQFLDTEQGRVPEGWVKRLSEVTEINSESIKRGYEPDSIHYVDIASVSTGRIEEVTEMPFSAAPGRARRIVRDGDMIWSTVRPNRKSYALILKPPTNMVVSTGFAVIRPSTAPYSFLYSALTTESFVSYLVNHAKGSAYPAVNSEDFENAPILVPSEPLLAAFHERTQPLYLLKHNLEAKNQNLRLARDLLLPKLISGELDVENLDIDTGNLEPEPPVISAR